MVIFFIFIFISIVKIKNIKNIVAESLTTSRIIIYGPKIFAINKYVIYFYQYIFSL